jgi:Mn2+/Fe2+ NRAMP family transporter
MQFASLIFRRRMYFRKMQWLNKLGPGLLYAGAAVGVSHIVQSTRAGAEYGYVLILAVLLAHLVKYPFFKMGPWYAAESGESLVDAYFKLGRWAVVVIFLLTFSTMFSIQAAVTVVTAGIAQKISGIQMAPWQWSGILLLICLLILGLGHYNLLSKLMKWIILLLSATTLIAVFSSFGGAQLSNEGERALFDLGDHHHLLFLVAFLGWMPAPLDISIWHSLWGVANAEGKKADVSRALFDFRIGFWGTAFLAICFVMLGANVLYGSGEELSSKGAVYAGQLIDVYTAQIGQWAYWVIAVAALTTMFSTTLTCLDASPRLLRRITQLALSGGKAEKLAELENKTNRKYYWFWISLLSGGTLVILAYFIENMRQMVDVATAISFITTPFIALLSYLGVRRVLPISKAMHWWIYLSLIILFLFAGYYLWVIR